MITRSRSQKSASAPTPAGSAEHPLETSAADDSSLTIPGKEGLIVHSYPFLDLETPVEYFNTWLTPAEHFFVRNHTHEPSSLDPAEWKLSIGGEVDKPYTLTLAELSKFEKHSVVNTLECAGNGRAYHRPTVPGAQWQKGAVGTARFGGPRLRALLERAGVKPSGKHVMFRGLDEAPGEVPPFIRSIPIEKATDADTLVATHMNNAALPKHHGFPARALVPGWIGAASCKWLTEIKVLEKEFEGNYMSLEYRMPNQPVKPGETVEPEDTYAVTSLDVKSLITIPGDGATLRSRTLNIQGVAWSGEADIVRVEVSADGGASWQDAQLGAERARYAWRLWNFKCKAPGSGDLVIAARATDSRGRLQPSATAWNPSGYLNNAVDQVRIHMQP